MHRRAKLKKKAKPISTSSYILFILTIVIIASFLLIRQMSQKISPILLSYGKLRIEQLSNQIVNNAISNELLDQLNINKLFIIIQNNDGQIMSIDFNPMVINQVLNDASDVIQHNLKALELGQIHLIEDYENIFFGYNIEKLKKGIIFEIPFGIITNVALLSNIGPKIPVRFALVGSLNTNLISEIKNYGINNVIVEVFIHIDLTNQLVAPLMSERILYQVNIPIVTRIIPGEIPKYYQSGINQSSPILSVPLE